MINSQGPAAGAFVGMGHVSGEHGRCASAHRTHGVADPAGTLLLARVLLLERIGRTQLVGLGFAAVAVSLLAVG